MALPASLARPLTQAGKQLAKWLDDDAIAAWIMLAPALILLGIFVFWPIVDVIGLSFTTGSFTREGVQWNGVICGC